MPLSLLLQAKPSYGYAMGFRPIRVNKSLLPEDLESLHERKWRVKYRREETVTWPADQDYLVEEVRTEEDVMLRKLAWPI